MGVKVNSNRPLGLVASQLLILLRDMSGMIVENRLDRGAGRSRQIGLQSARSLRFGLSPNCQPRHPPSVHSPSFLA
jgi:hypothetical protein